LNTEKPSPPKEKSGTEDSGGSDISRRDGVGGCLTVAEGNLRPKKKAGGENDKKSRKRFWGLYGGKKCFKPGISDKQRINLPDAFKQNKARQGRVGAGIVFGSYVGSQVVHRSPTPDGRVDPGTGTKNVWFI